MKKKIFAIFLSLIIFIVSAIPSFANPLAAGGLIVHLGRIANTLQIGLTAISIVDMGSYLFSRFTIPEQQELINAYNTDVNEFEELSYQKVKSLGSIGYHYPSDVYIPLELRENADVFGKPTDFFELGGSNFGYAWNGSLLGFTRVDNLDQLHILWLEPTSSCVSGNCSLIDNKQLYRSYDVTTGKINIYCKNGTDYTMLAEGVWYVSPSVFTCENCPHDTSNVNKVDYSDLTDEQKDYIKENYPQYDIESVPPTIDKPNDEPSEESPNFPEFDFGKLDLKSLSLSFDNFKNKFPFSIPFDIYNFLNILVVEPKAPIFEVSFLTETLKLDFSIFDKVSNIIRAFSVFSWVFVLFRFTKKFGE